METHEKGTVKHYGRFESKALFEAFVYESPPGQDAQAGGGRRQDGAEPVLRR